MEKIYLALYCDCIYESALATISVHRTRLGAEKAIADHKFKQQKEHDEMWERSDEEPFYTFDWDKRWEVEEIEVLE